VYTGRGAVHERVMSVRGDPMATRSPRGGLLARPSFSGMQAMPALGGSRMDQVRGGMTTSQGNRAAHMAFGSSMSKGSPRQLQTAGMLPSPRESAGSLSPRRASRLAPLSISPREMKRQEFYALRREVEARTPYSLHPLGEVPCHKNLKGYTGIGAAQLISPRSLYGGPYRAPPVKTRKQLELELAQMEAEEAAIRRHREEAKLRAAANPVDDAALKHWLTILSGKLRERFKEMRRSFRMLDEDKSGRLNRAEFHKLLRFFNLECVPDGVFDRLLEFTDRDGSGSINFDEFTRLTVASESEMDKAISESTPTWRRVAD